MRALAPLLLAFLGACNGYAAQPAPVETVPSGFRIRYRTYRDCTCYQFQRTEGRIAAICFACKGCSSDECFRCISGEIDGVPSRSKAKDPQGATTL